MTYPSIPFPFYSGGSSTSQRATPSGNHEFPRPSNPTPNDCNQASPFRREPQKSLLNDSDTQGNSATEVADADGDGESSPLFLRGNFTQAYYNQSQFDAGFSQAEPRNVYTREDNVREEIAESQRSDTTRASPFPRPDAVGQGQSARSSAAARIANIFAPPSKPSPRRRSEDTANRPSISAQHASQLKKSSKHDLSIFPKPPPFVPRSESTGSDRLASQPNGSYLPATPLSQQNHYSNMMQQSQSSSFPANRYIEPKAFVLQKDLEVLMGDMLRQMRLAYNHFHQLRENLERDISAATEALRPENFQAGFDNLAKAQIIPRVEEMSQTITENLRKDIEATNSRLDEICERKKIAQEQQAQILSHLSAIIKEQADQRKAIDTVSVNSTQFQQTMERETTQIQQHIQQQTSHSAALESLATESKGHQQILDWLAKSTNDTHGGYRLFEAENKRRFESMEKMFESAVKEIGDRMRQIMDVNKVLVERTLQYSAPPELKEMARTMQQVLDGNRDLVDRSSQHWAVPPSATFESAVKGLGDTMRQVLAENRGLADKASPATILEGSSQPDNQISYGNNAGKDKAPQQWVPPPILGTGVQPSISRESSVFPVERGVQFADGTPVRVGFGGDTAEQVEMKLEHPLSAQTIGAGPNVLDLTGTGPIQTSPPVVEATTLVRERRMQFANGTPVRLGLGDDMLEQVEMKLEHPLSAQKVGADPNVVDLTGIGSVPSSAPVMEAIRPVVNAAPVVCANTAPPSLSTNTITTSSATPASTNVQRTWIPPSNTGDQSRPRSSSKESTTREEGRARNTSIPTTVSRTKVFELDDSWDDLTIESARAMAPTRSTTNISSRLTLKRQPTRTITDIDGEGQGQADTNATQTMTAPTDVIVIDAFDEVPSLEAEVKVEEPPTPRPPRGNNRKGKKVVTPVPVEGTPGVEGGRLTRLQKRRLAVESSPASPVPTVSSSVINPPPSGETPEKRRRTTRTSLKAAFQDIVEV